MQKFKIKEVAAAAENWRLQFLSQANAGVKADSESWESVPEHVQAQNRALAEALSKPVTARIIHNVLSAGQLAIFDFKDREKSAWLNLTLSQATVLLVLWRVGFGVVMTPAVRRQAALAMTDDVIRQALRDEQEVVLLVSPFAATVGIDDEEEGNGGCHQSHLNLLIQKAQEHLSAVGVEAEPEA